MSFFSQWKWQKQVKKQTNEQISKQDVQAFLLEKKILKIQNRSFKIGWCIRWAKLFEHIKCQLDLKWIYEVIVSPKMPYHTNKDLSNFFCDFLVSVGSFFWLRLFGRAEILVILGLHFGRNDDLISSFWIIYLTFINFLMREIIIFSFIERGPKI